MVPILFLRREGDSNPRYSYPYDSLANCWFQPLTHLSKAYKKLNPALLSKSECKGTAFFPYTQMFLCFFLRMSKKNANFAAKMGW